MKPKLHKIEGVSIAVLHKAMPCAWELKVNPHRLPKIGDPPGEIPCFVAHEIQVPTKEWKSGVELPAPPPPPVFHDAFELRNRFMGLKTDQQFLNFLNRFGVFSPLLEAERHYGWRLEELIGCQNFFSELARRSPDTWSAYVQGLDWRTAKVPRPIVNALDRISHRKIEFYWESKPHRDWFGAKNLAAIETTDVVSSILTSIVIDRLRGAKFRACAREDCPRFFEVKSRHKKKYCDQPCAHLVSVRKTRAKQKRERAKSRAQKVSAHRSTEKTGRGHFQGRIKHGGG